jgi:hypothetical protein
VEEVGTVGGARRWGEEDKERERRKRRERKMKKK